MLNVFPPGRYRYPAPNHERAHAPAPAGGAAGRARLHRGDAHPERLGDRRLLWCPVHTGDPREGKKKKTHLEQPGVDWWDIPSQRRCVKQVILASCTLACSNIVASLWFNVTLLYGAWCLYQCRCSNRESCTAGMRCNYIGWLRLFIAFYATLRLQNNICLQRWVSPRCYLHQKTESLCTFAFTAFMKIEHIKKENLHRDQFNQRPRAAKRRGERAAFCLF